MRRITPYENVLRKVGTGPVRAQDLASELAAERDYAALQALLYEGILVYYGDLVFRACE